jgi:hypothetical protein
MMIGGITRGEIADPFRDYIENKSILAKCDIKAVQKDFNDDGLMDLCLAKTDGSGDRGGLIWTVYLRSERDYLRLEEPMIFRLDSTYFINDDSLSTFPMVLSIVPAGGGKTTLVYNRIAGKTVERGKYDGPLSQTRLQEKHHSVLRSDLKIQPISLKLRPLSSRYHFYVYADRGEFLRLGKSDESVTYIGPSESRKNIVVLSGDEITSNTVRNQEYDKCMAFVESVIVPKDDITTSTESENNAD